MERLVVALEDRLGPSPRRESPRVQWRPYTHSASPPDTRWSCAETGCRWCSASATPRSAGRTALAAGPGGPAGSDIDDEHDDDEDYDENDDSCSVSVAVSRRGARPPMRAFHRHASRGVAAYLIWAFLLPLIETMVAGMPGEGGILFITSIAGFFLPIIAFLKGRGRVRPAGHALTRPGPALRIAMEGQLTICFAAPATSPAATAPTIGETADDRREAPGDGANPPRAAGDALSRGVPADAGLPALRIFAGYEMYRDHSRTVIRKPGEARWGATVRTGPTTHRFVGAGPDPAALWSLTAREAACTPANLALPRA